MSDAADLVTTTIGGKTFRCTRRTEAHLLWTVERLAADHPDARLVILQGCYNVGVAASAGTHDKDAVVDLAILGLDWRLAQRWLREHGWAAWYRTPPTFSEHIHMVSLGYPGEVGVYVPGQVRDYYSGRTGLAGHAVDPSWRPADIDSTVFDYAAFTEEHEMNATQDARLKAVESDVKALVADVDQLVKAFAKFRDNEWKRDVEAAARAKRIEEQTKP